MTFQGALVKAQGVTFAIIIVRSHVIQNSGEAAKSQQAFRPVFPAVPIVLMAQNGRGVPTYYGRPDIVKFLANTPLAAIPWKEYSYS